MPLWSEEDDDAIIEKPIDDGFFEEKLGENMMGQQHINAFHKGKDRVMDLFAQADALRMDSSANNSFAKFDDIELMESKQSQNSPAAFSEDSFRQF